MRAEQKMLLEPRMLQSIEILQLPALALEDYLARAAEENEVLQVEPPRGIQERGSAGSRGDGGAKDEWLANQPARDLSLAELVEAEISGAELGPITREWVRFLVSCLDDAGYLSVEDEDLLSRADMEGIEGGPEGLALGLSALQQLGVPGLGARGAVEALLMQLDPDHCDYRDLCELLEQHLDELATGATVRVAQAMDVEVEELERLVDVLRELDIRPMAELLTRVEPVLSPEVVVEWNGSEFEVSLVRGTLPSVTLDEGLVKVARDREQAPSFRKYLRGRLDEARWIVAALEQRGRTLLAVASAAFRHQRAYLEAGREELVPLKMSTLAEELDIHVSTVSRAVGGKSAQTPWGVIPLRDLFPAAAPGGGDQTRSSAHEAMRAIVSEEDPAQPLSDDEIAERMTSAGFGVARRTVAKYRRELSIPSSYKRRR